MRYFTTIEQSKKLLELGLSPESADMSWRYNLLNENNTEKYVIDTVSYSEWIKCFPEYSDTAVKPIPCWSVSALMNILPNHIKTSDRLKCNYSIKIRKYDWYENTTMYQIAYGNSFGSSGSWHDMISSPEKENLIDACYEMVVWLLDNGFLKIEKQYE